MDLDNTDFELHFQNVPLIQTRIEPKHTKALIFATFVYISFKSHDFGEDILSLYPMREHRPWLCNDRTLITPINLHNNIHSVALVQH